MTGVQTLLFRSDLETNPSVEAQEPSEDLHIEMIEENETQASESIEEDRLTREQQILVAKERIKKLKEISLKIRTPQGLAEFEKQSAFERRQGQPENRTPSTESEISRYTIDPQNGSLNIRPNNGFLHDHVD